MPGSVAAAAPEMIGSVEHVLGSGEVCLRTPSGVSESPDCHPRCKKALGVGFGEFALGG